MIANRPPRFTPDRKAKARPRHPSRHVWTLRRGTDVRTCEVHEDRSNKGWDVKTFDNGWLSSGNRVGGETEARQLAAALRDDCIRDGWTAADDEPQPA